MGTNCNNLKPLVVLDEEGKSLVLDYIIPQTNEHHLNSIAEMNYKRELKPGDTQSGEDSGTGTGKPPKLPAAFSDLKIKDLVSFADWIFKEADKPQKQTLNYFPGIKKAKMKGVFRIKQTQTKKIILIDFETARQNYLSLNPVAKKNMLENTYIVDQPLPQVLSDLNQGFIIDITESIDPILKTSTFAYSKKPIETPIVSGNANSGVTKSNNYIYFDPTFFFFIKFHYKMLTYPGKTGFGKIIKTLSLLPGEETEIYASTYLSNESIRKQSECIIDSSGSSWEESFKENLRKEVDQGLAENSSVKDYENEFHGKVGGSGFTIGIYSKGSVNTSGGFSSHEESLSSVASSHVNNFTDLTTASVNRANQFRNFEVQSESFDKTTSTSFNYLKRTIRNVNTSHVLNFVFRQLVQEYISVTYLHDISILVPALNHTLKSIKLEELGSYLSSIGVNESQTKEIIGDVFQQLNSIYDFQGNCHSMIEIVPRELKKLDPAVITRDKNIVKKIQDLPIIQAKTVFLKRIKRDITNLYDGYEYGGIIMNVTKRVVNTSSAIVDAILSKGNALDCHNEKLREASLKEKELSNKKTELALEIIGNISDPVEKAKHFKEIFVQDQIEIVENED